MSFFGTDRRPIRRLWLSEHESKALHVEETLPALLFGARGEVVSFRERWGGLSAWLPEATPPGRPIRFADPS